jgi:baseplate J-like protein
VSYVQEPYAQFVDDLLTALTGGATREQFVFTPERGPFRLVPPGPIQPGTVRVFGQSGGAFALFQADRDFTLTAANEIQWRARPDGTPAASAEWPDGGTLFFVNYDARTEAGAVPLLSDRNPGSITRLLAESFAREYAVLSRQLEGVYNAGFLSTATGRDLDQLVALLGVDRLTRTSAAGSVVFSRSSPAPADITIAAGTRVSSAEPPEAIFETSEARLLRRGTLSVEAPVRAITSGAAGVVGPRMITIMHRPIFGVEQIWNPQGTKLTGEDEGDAALRARATRSLELAGRATTGAVLGALASIPQVREKDIRVDEDPLARPGIVTLNVAVPLEAADSVRAVELIEQTRPVGVRVVHNLDTASPSGGVVTPVVNPDDDTLAADVLTTDDSANALVAAGALFYPVAVKAVVVPMSALLTGTARNTLKGTAIAAIRDVVGECGIGEAVVYNRLVEQLMAIPGVLDVTLDVFPNTPTGRPLSHRNLIPPRTLRPTVLESEGGTVRVDIGGQLVALDVRVRLTLLGAGLVGDQGANREDARTQVAAQLREGTRDLAKLSVADLRALLTDSEFYRVDDMDFTTEYVDAGVRLNARFVASTAAVPVSTLERVWVRTVRLLESAA